MRKRSSKDVNVIASQVLEKATTDDNQIKKNTATVALGRLGGLKGGRVEKTTRTRRVELAKKAALARWGK